MEMLLSRFFSPYISATR